MRRPLLRSSVLLVAGGVLAASPLGVAVGRAAPLIASHPRVRAAARTTNGWASSNWSGYAITGSGYTAVTGSWVVPSVSASRQPSYSSSWIGIDGFNNSNLIQTGTEQDYYSGSAHYNAWWEILPAAETPISSITVHPGDHMSASITLKNGSTWTISIKDDTTGASFSIDKTYNGQRTSAEWIQEAPTVGGHTATLAHFSLTTFDPGTVNGGSPNLSASDSGVMIQKGHQVSTPSTPDADQDGFNDAYGSTAPAPPAS